MTVRTRMRVRVRGRERTVESVDGALVAVVASSGITPIDGLG